MRKDTLKQIIHDYFTFSKSERQGFTILSAIMAIVLVINYLAGNVSFKEPNDFSEFARLLAEYDAAPEAAMGSTATMFEFDPNTIDAGTIQSLDIPVALRNNLLRYRERGGRFRSPDDMRRLYGMSDSLFAVIRPWLKIGPDAGIRQEAPSGTVKTNYFSFDPNKVTAEQLAQLGVRSYLAGNIVSYRDRGGKFRQAADLLKIYGMDEQTFRLLEPWIEIEENPGPVREPVAISIDLNLSDSIQLLSLSGIGPVFASRIIRYRQSLGGFHSISQLEEVYGMTPERLSGIEKNVRVDPVEIRLIRLNYADYNELRAHPYISADQARKIIRSRSEAGPFESPDALLGREALDTATFHRVKPYLTER
jgi:DNA uptake protein ComE-like DNA-binding protein